MNPQHPHGNQPQPGQPAQPQPQYQDPNQPVAYDREGRPLYLHPPAQATPPQPQMVYMARPITPQEVHIPEEAVRRHQESRKKWPGLNLSQGEYVISAVRRHPIGLLRIWFFAALLIILFGAMAAMFFMGGDTSAASSTGATGDLPSIVITGLGLLYVLIILGALAATYVYEQNRFFLTNESVIQEIQTSLFDKHEQTVSLGNIEDASFKQGHIIESVFGYGTIRLSTEGDETTYVFHYVTNPKKHIATLNNAVEAFKNGRPVE